MPRKFVAGIAGTVGTFAFPMPQSRHKVTRSDVTVCAVLAVSGERALAVEATFEFWPFQQGEHMKVIALVVIVALAGCAGKIEMIRPTPVSIENSKVINRSRDIVWNAAIPALGKQFFVINNLDKSSGLVNISYTGDPEKYIDCGQFSSYVQNARGERTYSFPGASANQTYEVMNPQYGLFNINRQMGLEGRMNLVFEEIGPTQTRVTANTRYVVTRQARIQSVANNQVANRTDTISFNAGSAASFPAGNDGKAIECVASGRLEREVLSIIN